MHTHSKKFANGVDDIYEVSTALHVITVCLHGNENSDRVDFSTTQTLMMDLLLM